MLAGVVAAARWYIFTLRERHRRQGTIPLRSYTTCHYFPTCFVYISWRNKTCHLRPRQDMRTDRPTPSPCDADNNSSSSNGICLTLSSSCRKIAPQWPRSRRFVNFAMRNAVWTIPCLPLHSLASGVTHPKNTLPKKELRNIETWSETKNGIFL